MKKFFTEVGKDAPLHDFVHDVDKGAVGKAVLDTHGREVARVLSQKVQDAVRNLKTDKKAFNEPFRSEADAIADYVLADLDRAPRFADVVSNLVKKGMEPKRKKKKTDAGDTVVTTEWKFDRSRLETTVEEYLFGRTGVYFNLGFKPKKGGAAGDESIDLDDPFKSFRVLAVYLAFIGGTAKLWDTVIENTWVKKTPLLFKSRFKELKKDAVAQYKGKARLVLSAIGPDPRVFQRTEFRFSDDIAKQVEAEVFPSLTGRLPVEALPAWEQYAEGRTAEELPGRTRPDRTPLRPLQGERQTAAAVRRGARRPSRAAIPPARVFPQREADLPAVRARPVALSGRRRQRRAGQDDR